MRFPRLDPRRAQPVDLIWTGYRPQHVGAGSEAPSCKSPSGRACAELRSRPSAPRSGGGAERRLLTAASTRARCASTVPSATTTSWGRPKSRIDRKREIDNKQGRTCCYCGQGGRLQDEHVLPKSRGGPGDSGNSIRACRSCNASKGGRDMIAWFTQRARPTAAAHRDRASTSSWPPSGARRKARWTPRSTKRTTRNGPSTRSCYEQRGREPRKRAFCGRRLPDGYKPDERGLRRRVAHRARLRRTPPTARSRGRTPTAGRTRTPRSVCTPPPDYDIEAGPGGRAGSNESRGRTDPRPIRPDRIANAAFGRRIARIMYNNRGHARVPKKFQKKIRRGRHRSVGNPRSVRRPQGNSRGRGSPRTRGTGARLDDGQNPNG